MKTAQQIYRLLLCLYPPSYRKVFGAQMMQTFTDHYADVARSTGRAHLDFWLLMVTDEMKNIIRQHSTSLQENYPLLQMTTPKVALSALLFFPLCALCYATLVTAVLALPHPQVSGIGFLLALAVLLLLPTLFSIGASYVFVSILLRVLSKRKMRIA